MSGAGGVSGGGRGEEILVTPEVAPRPIPPDHLGTPSDHLRTPGTSELERTVSYVERLVRHHQKHLVWLVLTFLLIWVMIAVKEVTSLLVLAYVFALLVEPITIRLSRFGLSRGVAISLQAGLAIAAFLLFIAFAVPVLVHQYGDLIAALPEYLRQLLVKGDVLSVRWTGSHLPVNPDDLWNSLSAYSSMMDTEHLRRAFETLSATLLQGYSITLTLLNLVLFPFFFYYISCDLPRFHAAVARLLPLGWRTPVRETGSEILVHLYAFVRGQLTVSSILIVFYIFGLLLIGLPSAVLIGFLAGSLSVVPYLGVATGLVLSILSTLMNDPGWWPLAKVGMVFAVVQTLEGSVLTPRIVGESLGLHPLLVMLALVTASQLLGLLGLVIAIPLAATLRVLVRNVLKSIDARGDDGSTIILRAE